MAGDIIWGPIEGLMDGRPDPPQNSRFCLDAPPGRTQDKSGECVSAVICFEIGGLHLADYRIKIYTGAKDKDYDLISILYHSGCLISDFKLFFHGHGN